MSSFWKTWLTLWCLGVGVFGAVLYGAAYAATTGPAAAIFDLFGKPLPAQPDPHLRFAIGLMGAVTLGWAATLYAAFRAAWALYGEAGRAIMRIVLVTAVVWYVIDSAASLANGFTLNAVSNTVLLIALIIPLTASGALWQLKPRPA